ncbi:MAG: hypothetical protein OEZ36_08970 [Spirochaetota bacterium]|nr:hypothetical protein [Spirochaetota bacterium]
MNIIKEMPGKLLVQTNLGFRIGGLVSLYVALFSGIIVLPVIIIYDDPDLILSLIFPGIFMLIGGIFILINRKTVVDTVNRVVTIKKIERPFEAFGLVTMWNGIESGINKDSTTVWMIGLVLKESVKGMLDKINQMRKDIDASLEEESEALSNEAKDNMAESISQMKSVFDGNIMIANLTHELAVWQAGEKIAKTLNIPMIDLCGDKFTLRSPAELDLSLATRIKRGAIEIKEPGEMPEGLSQEKDTELMVIRWKHWGTHELKLSPTDITHKKRKVSKMKVQDLELIRLNSKADFKVSLISDKKVIALAVKNIEMAVWIRDSIEFYLSKHASRG